MDFLKLPEEIIIIIIRKLDTKSMLSLYNTCTYIRDIICMHNVVKACQLSLNTLATVRSLRLNFIKEISGHLEELDMCTVNNLSKSALLPALKKMRSLKTLNIAYTNVTLLDFIELYKVCPTIKNVVMDFQFRCGQILRLNNEAKKSCQNIFKNLENVHFVGSYTDLVFSGFPSIILDSATLNSLTYTIVKIQQFSMCQVLLQGKLKFINMNINIADWEDAYGTQGMFRPLDLEKNEFIVIAVPNTTLLNNSYKVYSSQKFMNFLTNTLGIDAECSLDCNDALKRHSNVAVMLWDKELATFDDLFYKRLLIRLLKYFPSNYLSCDPVVKKNNNWFYLTPKEQLNEEERDSADFKKRRIAPASLALNYDELFLDKQFVELTLSFSGAVGNPVTLSPSYQYLNKITFLSLTGSVRYSTEFFKVLFQGCVNLVTLNVEKSYGICAPAISKSIQLSKSIKHLRITDKQINFKNLFTSFSKCKTLENIYLHDMSNVCSDLADPTVMFQQCKNLYHLLIIACMTQNTRSKSSRLFQKVKSKYNRGHLHVELHYDINYVRYSYNPYLNIFKLIPIQL